MRKDDQRWGANLQRVQAGYRPPAGRDRSGWIVLRSGATEIRLTWPKPGVTTFVKVYQHVPFALIDIDGVMRRGYRWMFEGGFYHAFTKYEIEKGGRMYLGRTALWIAEDKLRNGSLSDIPF